MSVGIVLVTYNRAQLLTQALKSLCAQTYRRDVALYIIDNASTDNTAAVIRPFLQDNIHYICNQRNIGGAGGFPLGAKIAFQAGHEWVWLMDDDIVCASDCLEKLLNYPHEKVLMPAREDREGHLSEFSALHYDLTNPFRIRPKRLRVIDKYKSRDKLPELLNIENFSFEGVLIHHSVIDKVGLPFAEYFISGDDVDYAIRILRHNFKIFLVREAKIVRLLPFQQQLALRTWKGRFMYRNMFVIHFLYGKNWAVRLKPYILMIGAFLLGKLRKNNALSFGLLKEARVLSRLIKKRHAQELCP